MKVQGIFIVLIVKNRSPKKLCLNGIWWASIMNITMEILKGDFVKSINLPLLAISLIFCWNQHCCFNLFHPFSLTTFEQIYYYFEKWFRTFWVKLENKNHIKILKISESFYPYDNWKIWIEVVFLLYHYLIVFVKN